MATLPNHQHGVPPIGIGTYELRGDDCVRAVCSALQMGYRLVDTAAVYKNEERVGEGIIASGVPREELYVVVKIAMKSMGSDEAVRDGILESIRKLRIGYADCVLMHWPGCGGLKPDDAAGHHAARARCWRMMSALQRDGKVRRLGVSNFLPRHFAELQCYDEADCLRTVTSTAVPIVNQIELHPLCVQRDVDAFCRGRHNMVLQQYSPLGKGDDRLLRHPKLLEIHARYFGSTGGQEATSEETPWYSVHDLLVMWGLSRGYSTLVRSHKEEHLRANLAAAVDFFASSSSLYPSVKASFSPVRPLLTAEQLGAIANLRQLMGVEEDEDLHLCWYSSEIA